MVHLSIICLSFMCLWVSFLVRRQTMKVRITATGDTIILKFLRPEADTKLEGYILGYGSGMFSKQFIKLPEENEHYETEIDAEPKYLIVVQPVKANKVKKKCTGKVSLEKPLHLMIGTVTPTSVHLSWGTLLKTPYTDAHLEDCEEDGEFTVRYKEKETSHKWNYETCPTTDTVIDNLKPDTPYEFEVRAETKADTGAWSPPVTHNTAGGSLHKYTFFSVCSCQFSPSLHVCLYLPGSWFGTGPNSTIFRAVPVSDVDAMGKQRFTAPHVIYNTGKRPEEPCSVTRSLGLFPDEENEEVNVTGPPKTPPSNVTVVTVEGCPSFVIIDWQKTDNETTAYEILTKGPNGNNIAVVTNQTHTAVENLKPQSNYEFTVTPKNELGVGPPTEPVSFSTESADPRISDVPTGKTAIWSSFPFKADSYSECNGRQFVKRTWYRKFVGIQLCNSLRYKIYLSDSLKGRFYTIGDQTGYGEDHCQFVDSYLDGRTGGPLQPNQLPAREGYFRSMRQEPVKFGKIGGTSYINYVAWYECGVPIPGSW
uniref:Fibronectin type-III domain-containing protein n=1 Tax=Electrophorus electricus TaxID=8005 RepID=A0A4W4EXP8_ELEEL